MKRTVAALALYGAITPLHADGISYDHIDLILGYGDVDSTAISASISATENIYLQAGYGETRGFSPTVTAKRIGVGFHVPASSDSDIYFEYGHGTIDGTSVDGDVDTVEIGVRSMISDKVEVSGSWSRTDTSVTVSGYSVSGYAYGPALGLIYKVNESLSVTSEIDRVGGDTSTLIGMRVNY